MAEQQAPSASGLIWRNGLIFGGIYALVSIISTLIEWLTGSLTGIVNILNSAASGNQPTNILSTLLPLAIAGCVGFLIALTLQFVSGMMTARKTGGVGSAALTGLVTGAFGSLIGGGVGLVMDFLVVIPALVSLASSLGQNPAQYQQSQTVSDIVGAIFSVVVYAGIGAGLGALGGLVGRNSYQQAHPAPSYEQSFYQPGAYPPAPGYPLPQGQYAPPPGYPPAPGQQPPAQPGNYPPPQPPAQG